MRAFLVTAALATAALALGACHDKRPKEPVPPPQSSARLSAGQSKIPEVREISWFQGTLDEAFARSPCPAQRRPILSF